MTSPITISAESGTKWEELYLTSGKSDTGRSWFSLVVQRKSKRRMKNMPLTKGGLSVDVRNIRTNKISPTSSTNSFQHPSSLSRWSKTVAVLTNEQINRKCSFVNSTDFFLELSRSVTPQFVASGIAREARVSHTTMLVSLFSMSPVSRSGLFPFRVSFFDIGYRSDKEHISFP